MRTEAEIRKHLEDLKVGVTPGCPCPDCFGNTVAINVLSWVLGAEFDPLVDELFQQQVARKRMEKGLPG